MIILTHIYLFRELFFTITYIYNLQNDGVGICNSFGNIVVEYNYDARGRIIQISGNMANTLGTINPFRYRRYLFDYEDDLYYIETRYYLPEINRFAMPDLTICDRSRCVYCYNEIVKYFNPNGAG